MKFDAFNNPALMFRVNPFLCKGDWSDQNTQSSSEVDQTDSRVGASENATAIGAGAQVQAIDSSDRSFTDNSTVQLITQDQRDQSFHDERTFVDNSQNYTLDAELAKAALNSNVAALNSAAGVLERSIEAQRQTTQATLDANTEAARVAGDLVSKTNSKAFDVTAKSLERALEFGASALERVVEDTAAARDQQTGFLSSFYRDRENNDTKVTGDLIKYAGAAAVVGLLAWAVKE